MKSAALRALESQVETALAGRVIAPFRTGARNAPEMLPTGIAQLDTLAGGLPRGALTEVVGPASSGRTSIVLAALAAAIAREEACALVDASDAFDPRTASAAGVDLKRLLWVRCNNVSRFAFRVSRAPDPHSSRPNKSAIENSSSVSPCLCGGSFQRETRNAKHETLRSVEQALKSADLLLQSGGFGIVVVDLADVPPEVARRVPLTSWFRFRRAVEHTPTVLLVIEQEPFAKNCAALVISTAQSGGIPAGVPSHARLLRQFEIKAELTCDHMQRKPVQSVNFTSASPWASGY
jgi:recombination protein RecA